MNLSLQPYTDEKEKQWDDFVSSSRNGTIFHTRKFLSYHAEKRFEDASLLFLDGEKLVGVFPAALKEDAGKKVLVSHPGASYGGLVLHTDVSVTETGEMMKALSDYAKSKNYAGISMLRLPPASLQRQYSEDPQYWMFQQGYRMSRCEMDGAIDLSSRLTSFARGQSEKTKDSSVDADPVLLSLTGKCRNMVRQAERAKIEVKLSNDFDAFWPVLESVLVQRHGAKPTHTLEEIKKLHALLPQGFRCLTAHMEGKIVGGIVLVTIHSQALYTLYMGQEYASQQFHPMHLLLVEAIRLCLKEKRKVLHLGVSTEYGGTKVNEGLFFFKESFGCKPIRRESWELLF